MSKTAHIVAVRVGSLGDLGFGISAHPDDVSHIFDEGEVWIGPRPVLEQDEDFIQPIPYIVVRDGDQYLAYKRGAGGGDARLHSKVSIGFGGHVDLADAVVDDQGVVDLRRTMAVACIRELNEELGINLPPLEAGDSIPSWLKWSHVISANATPVDKVHIGLVVMIELDQLPHLDIGNFEDVIEGAYWSTADGFVTDVAAGQIELESWTALALSLSSQLSA